MTIDVKAMAIYIVMDEECKGATVGVDADYLQHVDNPHSLWPWLEDITQRLSRI